MGYTYFAVEADNGIRGHLGRPCRWREHEDVGSASVSGIGAELFCLSSRLCACTCNYDDVLETILIESLARKLNSLLALLV